MNSQPSDPHELLALLQQRYLRTLRQMEAAVGKKPWNQELSEHCEVLEREVALAAARLGETVEQIEARIGDGLAQWAIEKSRKKGRTPRGRD
jgi:hypothetical protein